MQGALAAARRAEDGQLRYAGKVGTGFEQPTLDALHRAMASREIDACPFVPPPERRKIGGRVHWIRPELVAEIEFMEWTGDGALRHPSFKALRGDKPAAEVRRDRLGAPPRRRGLR